MILDLKEGVAMEENEKVMKEGKINFISKEGNIEESAGRRKFYLTLEEPIREYERRMLCDSDCPFTLPMYFLAVEDSVMVFYDFTGYLPLREYMKKTTFCNPPVRETQKIISDALAVLTKILECMKGMESYLFYPERFSNHLDAIFMHMGTGQIAFAFYPNDRPELTLQSRIIQMTEEINKLYQDTETKQYLQKYIELIHMKNPGLDGMIVLLGTIQREVSYIYWNPKDFRGPEHNEEPSDKPEIDKSIKVVILKTVGMQGFFGIGLISIYLSHRLELMSFAGLTMLVVAVDLWILRRFSGRKKGRI